MEQMPGHRILGDRYEMTRRIDQCGETIVYLGRDAVSGRMVTVREFCPSPIIDRKSTRLNSSHSAKSRMPSSA